MTRPGSRWRTVDKVVVCIALAGNDHQAGVLLHAIVQRWPYAKATIPGREGTWSANTHATWAEATRLSRDQLKRALAKLERHRLIERDQHWWQGNPNTLHVRSTEHARTLIAAATTLRALDEIIIGEPGFLSELWDKWIQLAGEQVFSGEIAGVIARWFEDIGDKRPHAAEMMQAAWEKHHPQSAEDIAAKLGETAFGWP
jgi:hypothetical protein